MNNLDKGLHKNGTTFPMKLTKRHYIKDLK